MAQSPKNDSYVVPRSYQLEILEDIKKSNSILYLPTGCGKTFIATMLVKHMGECLTKPIGNGRKWTFFIVQSIPLVSQQANYLRRHLPWNIGEFSGITKIDFRSQEHCYKIIEEYQILVITAQIYLNNLYHGIMHIKDANLLIFDECHHAVASHPFKQIMDVLRNSNIKSDERPHILGLTATLINSNTKNLKDELHKLEITFDSTIKAKFDENIKNLSTGPKEYLYLYDEHILDNELLVVTSRISKVIYYLETTEDNSRYETELETDEVYYLKSQNKVIRNKLKNYFLDIEANINDGGAYIGYLNSLHFMIEIENKQKICKDVEKSYIMSLALSELTIIRKMLYDYMNKHSIIYEDHSTTLQNVSSKVKNLMEYLSTLKSTDSCLVFVLRQTTAKMLCYYINDYIQEYNQKNIVCDFIVGGKRTVINDFSENYCTYPKNNDIIKKFNSKITNVLITSQVLEEGIDIQICNTVIRYDYNNTFTSYIQSKGRTRSANSTFITFVSSLSRIKYLEIQDYFNKMEKDIEKILTVNKIEDEDNNDNNDNNDDNNNNNDDNNKLIMFKTEYAMLNYRNAINILNSYCVSLSQVPFLDLKPKWHFIRGEYNVKCILTLPINSIIKTPISGICCVNKKEAKQNVAFNACIELYKVKALDEYLNPVDIKNNVFLNDLKWFPNWNEEDIKDKKYKLKMGTKGTRRIVHAGSPTYLHGSYPEINKLSYLHVINCVSDNIHQEENKIFDNLLNSIKEFGILTSNKLPQVSSFPIFLHFGIVNVNIKVNSTLIFLDHKILKELDNFHNKLFIDVLGVKNFIARNYDNGDNSYLVVPIFKLDGMYFLDWNVININKFVETDEKPTMEQRNSKIYKEYLSSFNVITPWYKNVSPVQRYIVTDVYTNMTPESSFESSKYDTYVKYLSNKFKIHVSHKNQPLIKVKSLGVSKINYLTPRQPSDKLDNQIEPNDVLIPEFCTWHKFPSDYWLKALMLPTILYRLEKLLLAEELCVKMNSMCDIEVDGNTNKDSLKIDNLFDFNKSQNKKNVMVVSETLKYTLNNLNEVLEFDPNNFFKERIRNPIMSDLHNYQTFTYDQSERNYDIKYQESNSSSRIKEQINEVLKIKLIEMNPLILTSNLPPILSPLINEVFKKNKCPEQCDILKALTPPNAKDLFDYESMETYGDSFLKFAISLVLFDHNSLHNEGILSISKTNIVGNRNLFYVGRNSKIVSYMVSHFDPNSDWIPPCFGVPKQIKDTIENNNISPDVLYRIVIPKDNQITGTLTNETWTKIENELLQFKEHSKSNSDDKNYLPKMSNSQSDLFINKKLYSDKMVADCVESLIGTYVYKCGIEVGFKLLRGLAIIPKEVTDMFKNKPIENDLNISKILFGYEILEQRIGYSFKHKHLLVEALTHRTNKVGLEKNYERLEFLGDAIIDFLITTYIMEHGNTKTPHEITIIRSSLVSNMTFGSLSARIGLHRFILADCMKLTEAINRFYKYFQKTNYEIDHKVICLVEENDSYVAEYIVVPKVLSDLFESLIAAIYLDCNRDLNVVWTICYRLLEKEINEFCNNVPINPLESLYKLNLNPIFSKPVPANQSFYKYSKTMIQLKIHSDQKSLIVYGIGQNKKEAKIAAAIIALKNMKKIS